MFDRSGASAGRSRHRLNSGRWQLQLLGGLRARSGDIEIGFAGRAVTLLMARLALEPRSVHARSELAAMLARSGTDTAEQRRKRLNDALHLLREQLRLPGSPDALLADPYGIQLNVELFDIDVECFRDCVVRRDAAGARECYRGQLLPGCQHEWIDGMRHELAVWHDGIDSWPTPTPIHPRVDEDCSVPANATLRNGSLLPLPDGLIGRDDDLESLHRLLETSRVVTISGPPGCGKSRLAKALVHRLRGHRNAVVAALADHDSADTIADGLRAGVPLPACSTPALRQLATALAGKRALLVLDDAEHLVGPAADDQINRLLAALPDAQILLTSRRALRRRDEAELALGPLPAPDATADLGEAETNPAVRLFVQSARTVRADFHLHRRNLGGVVAICRAVEGIPFALELTASQVRLRSPDAIAELLTNRLQTLQRRASRGRNDSGRHASVQAALAGSWRLLDAGLRAGLQGLTTFRGGWTEAQASAVIGSHARELLDALVRDSLVQRAASGVGPMRWHLLRIVREFAHEQLSPAEAAMLRRRHRVHVLQAVQDVAQRFQRVDDADMANVLEAVETALADGVPAVAAAIAVALESHWEACGASVHELEAIAHVAEAASGSTPAVRVTLLTAIARAQAMAGRRAAAVDAARRAAAAAGQDAESAACAVLVETQVRWLFDRDGAAAAPLLGVAEHAQRAGWLRLHARALLLLGAVELESQRDPKRAARCFEMAERLFMQLGDRRASLLALPGQTACLMAQRAFRRAIVVATAGVERARQDGDIVSRLLLVCRIALCHEHMRDFDAAVRACRSQSHLARQHGLVYHLIHGAWNQCRPLARLRMPAAALRLLAFTCALCRREDMAIDAADTRYVRRVKRLAAVQLAPADAEAHWLAGGALTLAEGFALACGEIGPIPSLQPRLGPF